MTRPRLLDLFCGAGGAAMGYYRAGFDIVGLDIEPQPNYPFEFMQMDALAYLDGPFFERDSGLVDAIHASPPCQDHSRLNPAAKAHGTGWLLGETKRVLAEIGLPWVVENVVGSGLPAQADFFGANGLLLCGAMFGRRTYRHRLFEASFLLPAPSHPRHDVRASRAGHYEPGTFISVAGNCSPIRLAEQVMDIHWMTRDELAEAIPPYFTEYIGRQLLDHLERAA